MDMGPVNPTVAAARERFALFYEAGRSPSESDGHTSRIRSHQRERGSFAYAGLDRLAAHRVDPVTPASIAT